MRNEKENEKEKRKGKRKKEKGKMKKEERNRVFVCWVWGFVVFVGLFGIQNWGRVAETLFVGRGLVVFFGFVGTFFELWRGFFGFGLLLWGVSSSLSWVCFLGFLFDFFLEGKNETLIKKMKKKSKLEKTISKKRKVESKRVGFFVFVFLFWKISPFFPFVFSKNPPISFLEARRGGEWKRGKGKRKRNREGKGGKGDEALAGCEGKMKVGEK